MPPRTGMLGHGIAGRVSRAADSRHPRAGTERRRQLRPGATGDFRAVRSPVSSGALSAVTRFESRFERWVPEVRDNRAYVAHGLDRQEEAMAAGKPFEDLSTSGRLGFLDDVEEVVGPPGAHSEFYRLLVAALRGDGPLPVEPESAVYALEVIEAAVTSARTGQVVSR